MHEINLEKEMPTAKQAMAELKYRLKIANKKEIIRIIHGYGSTGKGGKIKSECHKFLFREKEKGNIKTVIIGENFNIFNEDARKFANLDKDKNLQKDYSSQICNHGVSYLKIK